MIQVCSQCGTRWNVRDRQRVWCPRCHGTLLAPSAPAPAQVPNGQWAARPSAAPLPNGSSGGRRPPRLPSGYRWIAVRPGAAPPPRTRRRPLGPTPRYSVIPRWGLVENFDRPDGQDADARPGPSVATVHGTVMATLAALAMAALIHVVRYALLLVNRDMLLNPVIAWVATWFGVLASVVVMFAIVASAIMLTNWLIARRAAAFEHRGLHDPRSQRALRAGCLIPFVNLVWAPLFVLELARVEERFARVRRLLMAWVIAFVLSTALSVFAFATSFTTTAQGIADNTVTTIVAYLLAFAALYLVMQIFLEFERTPVEHPVKRWVMVAADANSEDGRAALAPDEHSPETDASTDPDTSADSNDAVESEGQNPAA